MTTSPSWVSAFLDFARALERAPAHAPAWDGLSYLFKNTGLWQASLAAQQRAAAADSRYAHSIRRLSVLIYEGRLVVFYSYECDLGDGWEDPEVHKDPPDIRLKALQMGANIVSYVFKN